MRGDSPEARLLGEGLRRLGVDLGLLPVMEAFFDEVMLFNPTLGMCLPDVPFVLIERSQKRAAFLENCRAVLGLSNVTVENVDVQDAQPGRFRLCVFRSFHPLDAPLLHTLLGLLEPGGFLGAYKGKLPAIQAEMDALKAPPWAARRLTVPFMEDRERHLVVIHGALQRLDGLVCV